MTIVRALVLALLCAGPAVAAPTPPTAPPTPAILAAGDAGDSASRANAWIVIDGAMKIGDGKGARLLHAPGDAPPGVVVPAQTWMAPPSGPSMPAAIAAGAQRALLVFRRSAAPDTAGAPAFQVRSLSVLSQLAPGIYQYDPPGRLAAVAPLPEAPMRDRALTSLVDTAAGPMALLTPASPGAAVALVTLQSDAWREIPLPIDSFEHPLRLVAGPHEVALVESAPEAPSRAWRLDRAALEGLQSTDAPPPWVETRLAVSSADETLLHTTAGLVGASRTGAGDVDLTLIRAERRFPVRRVPGVPASFALAAQGDFVLLIWMSPRDDGREVIELAVVSALTGRLLHRGAPVQMSPMRAQDVQLLFLLLGAVMLLVVVFVLRPPAAARQTIVLPAGSALAEPLPRIVAGLADLLPCVLLSARVAGVGATEVLTLPFQQTGAPGMWPLATALFLLWLHSTVSECVWGRTIGKSLVGLRTASVTGTKPTLWQCVSRNAVKALAPPAILVAFLDPRRRHPGDLIAGTVVVASADEAAPDPPPGP